MGVLDAGHFVHEDVLKVGGPLGYNLTHHRFQPLGTAPRTIHTQPLGWHTTKSKSRGEDTSFDGPLSPRRI